MDPKNDGCLHTKVHPFQLKIDTARLAALQLGVRFLSQLYIHAQINLSMTIYVSVPVLERFTWFLENSQVQF